MLAQSSVCAQIQILFARSERDRAIWISEYFEGPCGLSYMRYLILSRKPSPTIQYQHTRWRGALRMAHSPSFDLC